MSGGSNVQLGAMGALDSHLTWKPVTTFFRYRYNKHTNFAMESVYQPFGGAVSFGSEAQITLNRTADLIYFIYVVIDLPGIRAYQIGDNQPCPSGITASVFPYNNGTTGHLGSACDPANDGPEDFDCKVCGDADTAFDDGSSDDFTSDSTYDYCMSWNKPWAHYTNAVAQFLIKRASLLIGGQLVSSLYNHFLYMWEELAGKPGKRLTELIGKRYTKPQLVADSAQDRRYYVPLPFHFAKTSGNALPLVSLQFHGVQIHIQFEDFAKVVQVSGPGVAVMKCKDKTQFTASDLKAQLLTTYVYLDLQERDRFAVGEFEQLIDQVQYFSITATSPSVRMMLSFNHPLIELIWCVQRKEMITSNNHFNYSGVWNRDPIKEVNFKLNNLSRFSGREGRYFRLVVPLECHTCIPESYTYCFSFALFPEDANPSGSCNASRIDNMELHFDLQDQLFANGRQSELIIHVYARNWNVFRYKDGLGGVAYSS